MKRLLPRRYGVALVPLGAWAVHELRYHLAFGSRANGELAAQGHHYLSSVVPLLALVAGLALGAFLLRLARTLTADAPRAIGAGSSTLWLWAAATVGLLAIFAGQELLEGVFATGHPAGLPGVFGGGGWLATPAALVVGGVLALMLRGAEAAIEFAARPRSTNAPLRRGDNPLATAGVRLARLDPLAEPFAPRAPPLLLRP